MGDLTSMRPVAAGRNRERRLMAGEAYKLDTSGEVDLTFAEGIPAEIAGGHRWSDLSRFTQGYIEALFASICPDEDGSREMRAPAFSDLAPETLARIIADCEARVSMGWLDRPEDGRWFWVSRQNGNLNAHPPLTVQLGDDGKVRFADPARPSEGEGAQ